MKATWLQRRYTDLTELLATQQDLKGAVLHVQDAVVVHLQKLLSLGAISHHLHVLKLLSPKLQLGGHLQ